MVGRNVNYYSHYENNMGMPQKLRIELPYNPASGGLSEEYENTNLKRYIHIYGHCSIIYNIQGMEPTTMSIEG